VIFDAIKALVFSTLVLIQVHGNNGDWFVVVKWGWHAGFGLAGIAMLLGLLFIFGDKIFNLLVI
jgi:dipeptide/tripeptide permease